MPAKNIFLERIPWLRAAWSVAALFIAAAQVPATAATAVRLQFDPVASPQSQNVEFPVTIRAVDGGGNTATGFTGTASLAGVKGTTATVAVGTESSAISVPVWAYYKYSRSQVFYRASEITTSGLITALSIYISSAPATALNHWTIRMQDTAGGYPSGYLASGWTVVYQNNESIGQAGWCTFKFATPFVHDAQKNLLVDFSFSDVASSNSGSAYSSVMSEPRTYNYRSNTLADPLNWEGSVSGASSYSQIVNIRLDFGGQSIPVTPATTGAFTAGVWSGNVAVNDIKTSVSLLAMATGLGGRPSNAFDVIDPNDHVPPVSSAAWIGPVIAQRAFMIAFSTSDDRSGIRSVALYYRRDGGPWTRYGGNYPPNEYILFDTGSTGGDGLYEFYTIATDQSYNVETAPQTADSSTRVMTTFAGSRVYVTPSGAGLFTGTDWANAAPTLDTGTYIAASLGVHEIWVAGGTYNMPLTMPTGVAIYGGFAGGESQLSQRDIALHPSTIDISGYQGPLTRRHAVTFQGVSNCRLDGFTVTGASNPLPSTEFGAGVYCRDSDNTNVIANCIVRANDSGNCGGGIMLWTAPVQVIDCTFSDNTAGVGGGVYVYDTTATLTRCVIRANSATAYDGGGVKINDAGAVLNDCVIEDNTAQNEAGGASILYSTGIFNNCSFTRNVAVTNPGHAATVQGYPENRGIFTGCTFSQNGFAGGRGYGAIDAGNGYAEVRHCTFVDNECHAIEAFTPAIIEDCLITGNKGGGLWLGDAGATVARCIISGNSSSFGGAGIWHFWGDNSIVTDCLISGNYTDQEGGGLLCEQQSSPTIINCTISSNNAHGSAGLACISDGFADGGNCHPVVINTIFSGNSSYGVIIKDSQSGVTMTNCLFDANLGGDYRGSDFVIKTGAAQLNTIPGVQNARSGNPAFLRGITGTNTMLPDYNPSTNQTTLYCANDTLVPNSLVNLLICPQAGQTRQGRIVGNTAHTINVAGDITNLVSYTGSTFSVLDYRLGNGSPAIDTGAATQAPAVDLAGQSRPVDIPSHGSDGGAPAYDIGAYEAHPENIAVADLVWVDFNWWGIETGSFVQPFDTLAEGATAVTQTRTVRIKAGASAERVRLTKPMRIESSGGAARIGVAP